MFRRFTIVVFALAFGLGGCKPAADSLMESTASQTLHASIFAPANATQLATFVSGEPQRAKPYAIENFLYAKHWLECKTTQPGLFSTVSVCELDDAGKTYGRANGWSSVPGPASCAACQTWSVPIAVATLQDVTDISTADSDHGFARYRYTVIPNEIGSQLGAWMSTNPSAWCGPDPRADGAWSMPRTGSTTFRRAARAWQATPPAIVGFDGTFADAAAATAADRACAAR